jgi:hypothetical protein
MSKFKEIRPPATEIARELSSAGLRSYKNLVRARIEDKSSMGDFRAVKLRMRRVGAINDSGGFVRISFTVRIFSVGSRIFFGGFLWSDRCRHNNATRSFACSCILSLDCVRHS